jgi:alpha-galactosidase
VQVGVGNLSFVESRSHFAAWCVVSSPLILGLDLTDDALMASVWPIIGNPEAIAVNQAYHGFSGSLFAQAPSTVDLCEAAEGAVESCTVPAWQSFYKPINATATAVLLMNHAATAADLSVAWADVPNLPCAAGGECSVRDLHRRANAGVYHTSYSVAAVESHDSVFLLLTMP